MRVTTSFFLLIALLSVLPGAVFAQDGTGVIRGFVYEESSGEPVIFTNVILMGTTIGAATDENGFFSLTNVPVGSYTVQITNIEFDTLREEVDIAKNKIVNLKLFLKKSDIQLRTVTVAAKTQEKFEEVRISTSQLHRGRLNVCLLWVENRILRSTYKFYLG